MHAMETVIFVYQKKCRTKVAIDHFRDFFSLRKLSFFNKQLVNPKASFGKSPPVAFSRITKTRLAKKKLTRYKSSQQQQRIWSDYSQQPFPMESVKRERKLSDESSSSRKLSVAGSARRFSATAFVSGFKKTDNVERSQAKRNPHERYENTYRLEPKHRFPEGKVQAIIEEALETLATHKYSATHSPFMAKLLSSRVLESVKQLNIERYKVICLTTIGSKASQGLRIASRCLWDGQCDTFVNACFENERFFAVCTVYGVYYE